MLNYAEIYKFGRIQTSQTGCQDFPLQSKWVFSGVAYIPSEAIMFHIFMFSLET